MENDMSTRQRPNHARESAREDCERLGAASITQHLLLQMWEPAVNSGETVRSATGKWQDPP